MKMNLKRKICLMSRTVSAVLSSVPEGIAEILAQGGSSIAALQCSCQKEYTQEQNRTLTLHCISSSQKLPVHNPVWQVNAASQVPESISGDLKDPTETSISYSQHVPNLEG